MNGAFAFTGKIIGLVLAYLLAIVIIICFAVCCSSMHSKIAGLEKKSISANISVDNFDNKSAGADRPASPLGNKAFGNEAFNHMFAEDSSTSGESLIMNAVREDSTGNIIATDNLKPIVVQARFRNVAERDGIVKFAFYITIPAVMQDIAWQVRFFPRLFWESDSMSLDKIYITGKNYRDRQLKGYEKFKKFCSSIIPDSSDFVKTFTRTALLRRFAQRNLGGKGVCDVTEDEAVDYYTKEWLVNANNRKKSRVGEMYGRYVKDPLDKEGIRLDTVVENANGSLQYRYVQTIKAQKGMRKLKLAFDGEIYKSGRVLYKMPSCDSLVFYVSSIVQFADNEPFFLKKVIERRVCQSTLAVIDFKAGHWDVIDTLFNNKEEIDRIRGNFDTLLSNKDYIIDSIVVTASCSPEGSYGSNAALAQMRAKSIRKYFYDYLSGSSRAGAENLLLISHSVPEDWNRMKVIVQADTSLKDRRSVLKCFEIENQDAREAALSKTRYYRYLREHVYPLLRRINFKFSLHRKGMVKDTIHTAVIDSNYTRGVEALKSRDYKTAIEILRPYKTLNTAVAYMCLNYNHSAMSILEGLKSSAQKNYMMAVLFGRLGDEKKAVKYFLSSVEMEPLMRHRGNLDPEVSSLIAKYGLFKE